MAIVRNREDQSKALRDAFNALGTIMLSSAYSTHHDPEFKDMINFEEFCEVFHKIADWSIKFDEKLKQLNKEPNGYKTWSDENKS